VKVLSTVTLSWHACQPFENLVQLTVNPVSQFDVVFGDPAPNLEDIVVGFGRDAITAHGS
jgi:hypothetical protein